VPSLPSRLVTVLSQLVLSLSCLISSMSHPPCTLGPWARRL
jgi:hypothetical protein